MYFVRKAGFYAVALWAALTLNFLIPRLLPGNPVDILLAKLQQRGGTITPETRRAYELLLGGDTSQPLIAQYGSYLVNVFRGDLGVSVSYFPAPVSEVIGGSLPWTIVLVGLSTIVAAVIGVTLRPSGRRESIVEFADRVRVLPQVIQVFFLGGDDDFLLHIAVSDSSEMREFVLEHLSAQSSVASTRTSIVFDYHRNSVAASFR